MSNGKAEDLRPKYTIVFRGHLDERRARYFSEMMMSQRASGETVLSGPVMDQAALYGILTHLRDLGLPLLLVRRGDFKWEE